jgi:hypothetical protein
MSTRLAFCPPHSKTTRLSTEIYSHAVIFSTVGIYIEGIGVTSGKLNSHAGCKGTRGIG